MDLEMRSSACSAFFGLYMKNIKKILSLKIQLRLSYYFNIQFKDLY